MQNKQRETKTASKTTSNRIRAFAGAALSGAMLMTVAGTVDATAEAADVCMTNADDPAIVEGNAALNRDHSTAYGGWTYTGDSNFNHCSDLTYAVATQGGQGNGAPLTVLMLFHQGQYIGIDSNHPQHAERVTANPDGSITVVYRDVEAQNIAGAPNVDAHEYTSEVTYFWDGEKVDHHGRIPNLSYPEF